MPIRMPPQLLAEARQLQAAYPQQVHFLLGNHEHAHLGGPRLAKFHADEAAHLERQYASGGFAPIRRWLAGWPLAAVAPARASPSPTPRRTRRSPALVTSMTWR
ncbi:hypothetical protein GCM10010170_045860 [Dactylosporangium salmoneum]|uniref:Calcineurin-like phosphoesterase domain-containing protein n=1 Tax=Dactylosporangium salmoneum TaxID=53361 RepID=A0ABN3GKJ3_9ACTN